MILKELIWEDIPHNNGFYLRRTPIFGGWLVNSIYDVLSSQGEYSSTGSEFTGSMTFVPDPEHKWDLKTDYSPKEPRMYL